MCVVSCDTHYMRRVLGKTWVRETDGVCTRGPQSTSAKVLPLVTAAQCQVTRHHVPPRQKWPSNVSADEPRATALSLHHSWVQTAACRCHCLLMWLHINTCLNRIDASPPRDPLASPLCLGSLCFLILDGRQSALKKKDRQENNLTNLYLQSGLFISLFFLCENINGGFNGEFWLNSL